MSADNYTLIRKKNNGYKLYLGCASNDYKTEVGTYRTLEEAIEENNDHYFDTEYGLRIDLHES